MTQSPSKNVLILQEVVKQYRVPFFEALHARCAEQGITLHILYGNPTDLDQSKQDNQELPAHFSNKRHISRFAGGRLVWLPCLSDLKTADLVISEQANKHLINYVLFILSALKLRKFAFWGHGRNFQSQDPDGVKERFKRWLLRSCDWWFAYTDLSARYIEEYGYPRHRITDVQNSVDTSKLGLEISKLKKHEIDKFNERLSLTENAKVVLYCGSLYPEKCVQFLLESVVLVQQKIPNLHLIVIGAGIDQPIVDDFCGRYPWIHFLGANFGKDKTLAFKQSSCLLNPGLVGLGIVDSFAAGLPIFTTDFPYHSPEIAYLEHGYNGMSCPHSIQDYSDCIIDTLRDEELMNQLQAGARESANKYSIENMCNNFIQGIQSALQMEA